MSQDFYNIFKSTIEINPSEKLAGRIFAQIEAEKDRIIRRRLMISRLSLGVSVAVFLVSIFSFGSTILQSEFWSIMSLVFSDLVVVGQNWHDFTYSLLETFPTMSVVAILAPVMTLMFSFSAYLEINSNKHKYI